MAAAGGALPFGGCSECECECWRRREDDPSAPSASTTEREVAIVAWRRVAWRLPLRCAQLRSSSNSSVGEFDECTVATTVDELTD